MPLETVKKIIHDAAIIFDVGAKYGDYAEQFAALFPSATIYAFEPAPDNFVKLEEAQCSRVIPVNAAVMPTPGEAVLNLYSHAGSHSTLQLDEWDETELVEKIFVDAVSIDSFCEERDIPHIDILKVDVEGAELMVLWGAMEMFGRNAIGTVVVELTFYPYFKGQSGPWGVIDFLRSRGMMMVAMLPVFHRGDVRYADAIFIKEDIYG